MKQFLLCSQMVRITLTIAAIIIVAHSLCHCTTHTPTELTEHYGEKMGGKTFTNSIGMNLVPVPGTSISMATTEVTKDQWKSLGFRHPSGVNMHRVKKGNEPVSGVSWNLAQEYCRRLSQKEGRRYRLPTDHEWSCAVGIGHLEDATMTPAEKHNKILNVYPWGQGRPSGRSGDYRGAGNYRDESYRLVIIRNNNTYIPDGFGNIYRNSRPDSEDSLADYYDNYYSTAPVGYYHPNWLGIYDLGGNVSEWCEDELHPGSGTRVQRGGSWRDAETSRILSSSRSASKPSLKDVATIGFRVVCE